jgi:hypothetical protein
MDILFGLTQFESPGLKISDCEWQDIVDLCDAKRVIKRQQTEKWQSGWLSPAILRDGAKSRLIADVVRMASWIGLDIDHANWSLRTLLRYLGSLSCMIYSTTRSTSLERRWRVLLPVSREMTPAEYAGVWSVLNNLLDGVVDIKTRNLNRLHYLPATWIGGNNEYHVQDGATLDVDELLAICPPEEQDHMSCGEIFHADGVSAPDGTEILTQSIIDRHVIQGKVGGRFFKLLCAAATRYKANGWALSASELANAALLVSPKDSSGMNRALGAYREAARAISWIDSRVEIVSAQDRLVNLMKWKWQQQSHA